MRRLSLRDRFFTPPVARAMTSPGGILLAGAGAAVGIVAGFPLVAAGALGAAAWAGRVAVAVPRAPRSERIDPFALKEPWRQYVRDALQAKARFDQAVTTAAEGPLRDRLREIGDRLQTGVDECWRTARRGQALADARRQIDVADIERKLDEVTRDAGERWAAGSSLEAAAEAMRSQLASAERMDRVIEDALVRLRTLDARMDEAVTRSIELTVRAESSQDLGGLGADIDNVVSEMEALRQALDETSTPGTSGTSGTPGLPPADDQTGGTAQPGTS